MAQIVTAQHRFVVELLAPGGGRLHEASLEKADFARAVEATFFEALRRGAFAEYAPPMSRARVEPAFSGDGPQSAGFEVVLPTPAGEVRRRFGLDYFRTFARRTGAQLILAGTVENEATIAYRLTAFADLP